MEEVGCQLKDLNITQSSNEDEEILQGKNGESHNTLIHK